MIGICLSLFPEIKKKKVHNTYICTDTASPQSCCWLCPHSGVWGPLRRRPHPMGVAVQNDGAGIHCSEAKVDVMASPAPTLVQDYPPAKQA